MMVHRVENTLLLDDFDVYDYLMKSEWSWLKDFFYENIVKTMSEQERMSLTPGPGARQALQLTQQFLSHSVVERPSPLEPPVHAENTPMCLAGPFLPEPETKVEGPSNEQPYNRNVLWTFEDIHMLVGSDLPIFGDKDRPCVSLRLRDARDPINVLTGIDYWLDNLMCNVPEDTVEGEGEGEGDAENDNEQEGEADPDRVREILADVSPWDTADDNATDGTEWANFGDVFATPIDPFAPVGDTLPSQHQHAFDQQDFTPFWHYNDTHNKHSDANCQTALDQSLQALSLGGDFNVKPMDDASTAELTNNLLTAMSSMTPDVIADIVSAMPQPDEHLDGGLVAPLELVQSLPEPLAQQHRA
ncbi:Erythroid differentiation-related factor 1 [Papilio machaon]|uniref:Erythroid differentiation-related factor 1 n=1 Tax=Papilio machaon TaxID=76193 RepID=A0A0N1PI34_PAPMA|nr:Erythroid differentiation-related factor 1 [Papilio machaon]